MTLITLKTSAAELMFFMYLCRLLLCCLVNVELLKGWSPQYGVWPSGQDWGNPAFKESDFSTKEDEMEKDKEEEEERGGGEGEKIKEK